MSKQKKSQGLQERPELTGLERLGLRVSAMIGSPVAQIQRWVTIHRLDTDGDQEWEAVLELLAETDGIDMTFNDDGTVTLKWDRPSDEDRVIEGGELEEVNEPPPF
ncbi:Phage protein [Pseudomonas chlororaphis subsp. piscium]|uniref:DUF1654 domain-containing protein n=1 Tax=Pseudomonas chlororaphis TaxID=587753 RepID=UPI000F56FCBF|nr:DUF1654 domain-containing protein [Pseudomonas chlororaphis]AZC52306.1 Phage protein [Pseudomonas chlororaphis subsp. piscium]